MKVTVKGLNRPKEINSKLKKRLKLDIGDLTWSLQEYLLEQLQPLAQIRLNYLQSISKLTQTSR